MTDSCMSCDVDGECVCWILDDDGWVDIDEVPSIITSANTSSIRTDSGGLQCE